MALGVAAREEMEHTINITCITDGADFILKFSEFIKVAYIYPQSFPIRQMIDNGAHLGCIYAIRIEFQNFIPPLNTQLNAAAQNPKD